MKNLSIAARLVAAIVAVGITVVLLHTVLSIAAPQRDILIAKTDRASQGAGATRVVALASADIESLRK